MKPEAIIQAEIKKDQLCAHGLQPTLRNPCPKCTLNQLTSGGGTPLTRALLEYVEKHKELTWYDAAVAYWTEASSTL